MAERTLEFRFDKPPGMTFKAGQFMDLTLIDPPETDAEGNTRGFSINSAPDDPELTFTTRLRDTAFKRGLQTMPLGAKIKVEGPFGNLTLHNDPRRPAVLLAGGIGITPFRSIVRRAAHEKLLRGGQMHVDAMPSSFDSLPRTKPRRSVSRVTKRHRTLLERHSHEPNERTAQPGPANLAR